MVREFTRERRFRTRSVAGTLALGETLAEILRAPRVVVLKGELGAGKTTLVKGIVAALGAGAEADVLSPTFTLVHEYAGWVSGQEVRVYHLDLYRLETERELATLGLEEMAGQPDALLLVEWGEKFASVMERADALVEMEDGEEDERLLVVRWREG